ncbi:hypothetical protein B0H63DRAFT_19233 [Podospora didyma]|uniref:RRM domain-containing protein n=1 Tax=Podospora didyma TaxID=330526 RepID=A0AAE0P552_9PEZI|nr:hypothetical protein B0H63DRAFT_19233 [Podospora didyma]
MDNAFRAPQLGSADALAEGRRIYVGNLLYSVKPVDVEGLLKDIGFGTYEKIHISVDPISGRNPGYCFVEFPTREEAERALVALPGVSIFDRALKVGPCHPKSGGSSESRDRSSPRAPRDQQSRTTTFDRWGDWNGERKPVKPDEQGPYGALQHLASDNDGLRLYVGGLGPMLDQAQNEAEIQALFEGFEYVAIGKRITPHPSTQEKPGNHHFCFVDFASAEEASRAIAETNGKSVPGGRLRVFVAKGKTPAKTNDTPIDENTGAPARGFGAGRGSYQPRPAFGARRSQNDQEETEDTRAERNSRQKAILESSSWRRGPA